MSADFTPSLNSYTDLTPFRFWCQKVLPLVYEDSLSYYELLCKVIDYLNKTMEDVNLSIEDVEKLHTAYESLQGYVNDYFDNLDVQEEINNKLDALVEDGTIHDIFNPDVEAILNVANQAASDAIEAIPSNVTAWLDTHVTPDTDVLIDESLTIDGAAADAKATGDQIRALKSDFSDNENAIFTGTYNYSVKWESGTIRDGRTEASSTTRKRTGFLSFGKTDTVHIIVPNGKRIYGWSYSSQSMESFVNSVTGGWQTESFDLTNDEEKYYRFTISDNPESESMVSESGFLFESNTFSHALDEKIESNQAFIRANGRNLFNPNESVDRTSLSTTGSVSTNNSYWTTGYIKVTGITKLLIPTNQNLRYCWYSSASPSGFISYDTKYNPLSVPEDANYIRVCYSKSAVAFEDRWKLFFTAYNSNPAFDNFTVLNYKNISEQDNQHFYISGDYTETFSISVNRGSLGVKNQIVSFKGSYSGIVAPTIQFKFPYSPQSDLYTSQVYTMDEEIKQWRVPAFLDNATKMVITITIPEGVTLSIKHLFNAYDNTINPSADGYMLWSHLGAGCIYPTNTTPAFNSAATLGYPGCVTVPKRTSDGVWVCFHDDSNVGNTLRMPDGSALPSADASKSISDFTYDRLMDFDAGIRRNRLYAGEKIPTLESFFSLCQKTGMHPVLSVHPIPTVSEWAEIKALTDKYNVTDKLSLKFGSTVDIAGAYNIFGDTIESYCLVVSTERDAVQQMIDLGLTVSHATLGIEWTDGLINATNAANAISNGFWVGAFIQYGTAARYKEVMAMGVTEITDDNNCSFGLNW